MTAKRVVPREKAHRDVEKAIDHYAREAGQDVALSFVNALEAAYRAIAKQPRVGSPRYAHELGLPGLRHRRLARFPWLIFYIERDEHIDVWRVLHAHRDIPGWLEKPDDNERSLP
nr:plasmid stabilization protein [Microbacterium terregens]